MIQGGYYIKARKIQDSEIAHAPPHVREIWDWLIKEANHTEVKGIKRGTTVRSLREIQEGLRWYVGYRKEMYSKSKCEMAMNWLRKRGMIETTKTTRGMIISVCKYAVYQDPKNYETNNETNKKPTRNQQPPDTINKNDKNDKNENKREGIKKFTHPPREEVIDYFKERGSHNGEADKFLDYFDSNGWKVGGKTKMVDWKASVRNWLRNKPKFEPEPQIKKHYKKLPPNNE